MRFALFVLLAALGMGANAAFTLSFEPANPTPADRIVVTVRDSSPTCPSLRPGGRRFIAPNEIRLEYSFVGDCGFAPFSEVKATLGPLPAGIYTVGLAVDSSDIAPPPGPVVTKELRVSFAGGPSGTEPLENYAGHYLTGPSSGEGVFIEQFGLQSFLTFATYDSAGRPTWLVMPDARWGYNTIRGRYEFAGSIYRAMRGEESPPAIRVNPVGTGAWYPTGFDTVTLETTMDVTLTRTLRRFRF